MNINSISFQGVYRGVGFSPVQYVKSEQIKNRLTNEVFYQTPNGRRRTAAEDLEAKGYDILISPVNGDSISVNAVKGMKTNNKKNIYVGTYGFNSDFSPKDVYSAINERKNDKYTAIISLIALAAMLIGGLVKSCDDSVKKVKTESIINKNSIKSLTQDTIQFIRK